MSTLEVIHLRMGGKGLEGLEAAIRTAVGTDSVSPELRIFRHTKVEGDLLIHIFRSGTHRGDEPSAVGLGLASLLRIHGLVEHSVWVQQEKSHEAWEAGR